MPQISDATLKAALAATLKVDVAAVKPHWDAIITEANQSAYREVVSRLARRGFSQAQIDAWARLEEFNTAIGRFWCLVLGAGLHGYDSTFVKMMDRREELDEVTVADVTPPSDEDAVGFGPNVAASSFIDPTTGLHRSY